MELRNRGTAATDMNSSADTNGAGMNFRTAAIPSAVAEHKEAQRKKSPERLTEIRRTSPPNPFLLRFARSSRVSGTRHPHEILTAAAVLRVLYHFLS